MCIRDSYKPDSMNIGGGGEPGGDFKADDMDFGDLDLGDMTPPDRNAAPAEDVYKRQI